MLVSNYVRVLGTKSRSSAKETSVNCWATSPANILTFLIISLGVYNSSKELHHINEQIIDSFHTRFCPNLDPSPFSSFIYYQQPYASVKTTVFLNLHIHYSSSPVSFLGLEVMILLMDHLSLKVLLLGVTEFLCPHLPSVTASLSSVWV